MLVLPPGPSVWITVSSLIAMLGREAAFQDNTPGNFQQCHSVTPNMAVEQHTTDLAQTQAVVHCVAGSMAPTLAHQLCPLAQSQETMVC